MPIEELSGWLFLSRKGLVQAETDYEQETPEARKQLRALMLAEQLFGWVKPGTFVVLVVGRS